MHLPDHFSIATLANTFSSFFIMELFPRFCCWTLIWLSCHGAWIRQVYWRYRSLIDTLTTSLSFALPSFPSDSQSRVLNPPDARKVLQNQSCVTADEVHHLLLRAPCKSSDLDPIPTSLVKDCIDILITPITSIINLSLTEGSFPSHFKSAHVSPPFLLKKPPSIRIAWRITGLCLILASFPRFLRK